MPTLRLGDAAVRIRVPVGDALVVTAPAGSSVTVVNPDDLNPSATVTGATRSFGPYSVTKTLTVTCTAGAVSFDVPDASKDVTEDPTTSKLYADGGELTAINSLVSGAGIPASFTNDTAGRVATVTSASGTVYTYAYSATTGLLSTITGGGVTQTFNYGADGTLSSVVNS